MFKPVSLTLLRNNLNDEILERVAGQQVLYYPISVEHSDYHEVYGEAIEKTYLPPVRVYALVEWMQDETAYLEGVGVDRVWQI